MIWFGSSLFFFKKKTAYEMRISDWSSDVCSSDLDTGARRDADGNRDRSGGRSEHRQGALLDGQVEQVVGAVRIGAGTRRDRAVGSREGDQGILHRSEAPRLGQECVSTCRYRGGPVTENNKQ